MHDAESIIRNSKALMHGNCSSPEVASKTGTPQEGFTDLTVTAWIFSATNSESHKASIIVLAMTLRCVRAYI